MLTFAEELILIALDDKKGTLVEMPLMSLEYGLVGAILMELAIKKKIDNDVEKLVIVDDSPLNDELFDRTIEIISKSKETKSIIFWIKELVGEFPDIKDILIKRLIDKKILKKEKHKILWVFSKRCYPVIDNKEEREVKTRIREIIFNNEIPEPRDIVLISLVNTCNLTDQIFSKKELEKVQKRVIHIAKMDLIGQAVSKVVKEIQKMVFAAVSSVSIRPTP